MSFSPRNWQDRVSQYPNRRVITNVEDSTDTKVVTVTRDEGTITQTGDPLNADALNNLESRISQMNTSLVGVAQTVTLLASAWTNNTITVNLLGVTATSNQEIFGLPATSAANIQNNKALQSANLMDYGQTEGSFTLYADTPPSVDLQIRVIVRS